MKNTLSNFLIFAAGAAIGSVVTWKLVETRYARIAQEEIDSYREICADRGVAPEPTKEEESEAKPEIEDQIDIREYASKLSKQGYTNYASAMEEVVDMERPYVIPPGEFGELYGYEMISLTYYKDGVLTDDQDEPVEDVDNVVGLSSLTHFGEYEDDSVFVRNDRLKADFEILADSRNYADVVDTKPHLAEGK